MVEPGQSMEITEWLALFGIKTVTLLAGFFGATVALVGTPRLTFIQLCVSIVAGVAFAVYVEPIVTHIFGWPQQVQGGVAFLLGLGGLVATAGAVQVWKAVPGLVLGWIERKLGR